jgi:hypothetical protein
MKRKDLRKMIQRELKKQPQEVMLFPSTAPRRAAGRDGVILSLIHFRDDEGLSAALDKVTGWLASLEELAEIANESEAAALQTILDQLKIFVALHGRGVSDSATHPTLESPEDSGLVESCVPEDQASVNL